MQIVGVLELRISNNFQKFIFGVVLEEIKRDNGVLKFDEPPFQFRPKTVKKESIRNLFKHLDFSYPRDENGVPLSYTKLDSKEMTRHVEWIVRQCAFSSMDLPHVVAEWNRLVNQYKDR